MRALIWLCDLQRPLWRTKEMPAPAELPLYRTDPVVWGRATFGIEVPCVWGFPFCDHVHERDQGSLESCESCSRAKGLSRSGEDLSSTTDQSSIWLRVHIILNNKWGLCTHYRIFLLWPLLGAVFTRWLQLHSSCVCRVGSKWACKSTGSSRALQDCHRSAARGTTGLEGV